MRDPEIGLRKFGSASSFDGCNLSLLTDAISPILQLEPMAGPERKVWQRTSQVAAETHHLSSCISWLENKGIK